jgi:DNA-binding XRE family transcriptional regulator
MYSGESLKRFRNLLGLKQERVAKNLDVSQQAYAKIEKKENICEDVAVRCIHAMNTKKEVWQKFIEFYPVSKKC